MKQATPEAIKAFKIGFLSICTYLACYFFRQLLSVYTPAMLETGLFTKESIALLSSTYMLAYAGGQLINGTLGDYIKPRYMVLIGLILSGISLIVFPNSSYGFINLGCFAVLGFGLSMLRGPLVKVISENSLPRYARISCVFLSASSFAGPVFASLCSIFWGWKAGFTIAGIISFAFAIVSFLLFLLMEYNGLIVSQSTAREKHRIEFLGVFHIPDFLRFFFLGMIFETVISSIGFWIPTYLNEHLNYSQEASGAIFSVMSILKTVSPFICLFMLRFFKDDCVKLIRYMFILCAAMYALLYVLSDRLLNVGMFTLARTLSGVACAGMWSVYIPSLGKTGRVSSANGILDCSGYIGAATANYLFAVIMENVGWDGLVLSWSVVFILGIVITLIRQPNASRQIS